MHFSHLNLKHVLDNLYLIQISKQNSIYNFIYYFIYNYIYMHMYIYFNALFKLN